MRTTFAPPNALRMWTDGRSIYVELPGHILSYPLTEGGLSKALSLLKKHADYSGTPLVQSKRRKELVGTVGQHAAAENILRRRGLIR